MTDLPPPPVAEDCDLRRFPCMPLDVMRLRDSDLAAIPDPEAFRAAVLLWCASWHQVPAGSLPDDDVALCRMAGYGREMRTWRRAKAGGALRGWVKHSDGKLYHPVVTEKVIAAESAQTRRRLQTESARTARALKNGQQPTRRRSQKRQAVDIYGNEVSVTDYVTEVVTDPVTTAVTHTETSSKGKERKGSTPNPLARLDGVSFEPGTNRPVVNGWYLDRTLERVTEAGGLSAGISAEPLVVWLRDGLEPDDIVAAVERCAARPNYKPPNSLRWFDRPVRDHKRRAA